MCDDLFDDSDAEETLLEKSWKKTIDYINTEGYREGIDVGKEESVQSGFNDAFAVATQMLFKVAKLRGNISGQLSRNFLRPASLDTDTESALQILLQDVCTAETELLQYREDQFTAYKFGINESTFQKNQSTSDAPSITSSVSNSQDSCEDETQTLKKEVTESGDAKLDVKSDSGKDLDTLRNVVTESGEAKLVVNCDSDKDLDNDKNDDPIWLTIDQLQSRYRSIVSNSDR